MLRPARLFHGGNEETAETLTAEHPMAKKVGRPKKPSGEGRPVRVDSDIAMMASKVSAYRGVSLSEFVSSQFGSSGKSPDTWDSSDTGAAAVGMMAAALSPYERMPMLIPVYRRCLNGVANPLPRVEVTAFQGQRPQNFPPGLDHIHVGRIFRLEHELPSRMPKGEE